SSRRRHTRLVSDWSSDVCSSDLTARAILTRAPDGTISPEIIPGHEAEIECDTVIICIGQRSDLAFLPSSVPANGLIQADRRYGRSEERRVGKEGRARECGEW